MFKPISASIAVGSDAQPEDLKNIAQQGYKTLIDLCTVAEGNHLDAVMVQGQTLGYVHVPVSPRSLDRQTLEAFKEAVETSPQPVYVRCNSALRAGVFALLVMAEQGGWSEAQYLEHFEQLNINQKPDCPLKGFAHAYFEQKL